MFLLAKKLPVYLGILLAATLADAIHLLGLAKASLVECHLKKPDIVSSFGSMFSPYHTSGFYCASVTKGLLSFIVLTSVAFNVPLSAYKSWFHISYTEIFQNLQVDKYLASRCIFLDPKDILCASVLLYHFRIFERRYGSAKFMSYFLGTFALSNLLELVATYLLHQIDIHLNNIPTGPWGPVFAMFIPYFCDIPRVAVTHLWGIPFTGKSVTYIIGLQMLSGSLECLLLATFGLLSGIIYRQDILKVQSWLRVPRPLGKLAGHTLGRLFYTPSPSDLRTPMGATIEIQRQQHMEQLEQQMIWAQVPRQQNQRENAFGIFGRRPVQNNLYQPVPPSEEHLQLLTDMGFARDNATNALQQANNDLQIATTILLQQR